MDFVAL